MIISNSEKTSREVNFTDGLNIIIGENKTGKSSIIKSIFYSLGCETEMDKSWLDLIDIYILKFRYGFKNYYILRKDKSYRIIYESEQLGLIIETNSFSEFSECLVKKYLK
ncbi:AAA family ATPase [Clostridium perfringens]|nr:AAA family ATPase [Clostridium perfringens]